MSTLQRVLAVALLAVVARADWTDGDAGVDHMYADLGNFNMTTNSTAECAAACGKAAECVGWVVSPSGSCGTVAVCFLKHAMGPQVQNDCRISGFMPASALAAPAFVTTPVGAVTPSGWLMDELTLQGQGLTGYLASFWGDIMNSSWMGGPDDGGLHERTPYWLNGLVPLSYLTGDSNLATQRDRYLQYIMDNQAPSGWLGIDDLPGDGNQYWGRFNIVLSLIQYYEASSDPRAMTCLFNYLGEARRRMQALPLGGWATVRAQDFIMGIWWLIDAFPTLKGVPQGFSEAFLIDLADLTHDQMLAGSGNSDGNDGDWKGWFDGNTFPTGPACVSGSPCNMLTHGVNIGQAIKSEAVWFRRSQDQTDADSTYIRMNKLDRYHGVPSGMYQADEHLAGYMPSHGTETCAVVEAIVSYAVAAAILGDASLFERAERIAYNALPAAMTKGMWERVYLQQSNEVNAIHEDPHIFYTDGADSATFSLEGNYGCCTANMHAGWPKLALRAVALDVATGGVVVGVWAPLTAVVASTATVTIATDYPFGDVATVTVVPAGAVAVPVKLRVPSWAADATLSINGGAAMPIGSAAGTFYVTSTVGPVSTTFTIAFNPTIRLETRLDTGAVTVLRGALVYSLWIGQNVSVTAQYAYNSQDLAVYSTVPWNVALVLDRANPSAGLQFTQVSRPSSVPFNSTNIPLTITGMGRVVSTWGLVENAADQVPASPACAGSACGAAMPITLVPFGSTHVRMAVLPTA